jgi:hypothetical protein
MEVIMRNRSFVFIIIIVLITIMISFSNSAEADDVIPEIVMSGINAYKEGGAAAAIKAWIKGSPFEDSQEVIDQTNRLIGIEIFYGKFVGYSLIHITDLTPFIKIVYFSIDFQKGPAFVRIYLYKSKTGWIMTGKFSINTDANQIIPESLLSK